MTATENKKGTTPVDNGEEEIPLATEATTNTEEQTIPGAEEAHEEFMQETGRRWSKAFRQRIRNGWERTKRFGRRVRHGIKRGSVKTGHGVARGTKATGRGAKKAGEAIAVAILAMLYGIGRVLYFVCYLVLQTVAYAVLGIALVVGAILVGIASGIAYICWLALKLIAALALLLCTPWYARADRHEKRNPLTVPSHHVRTYWRIWRTGMRPRNWHKVTLDALSRAALDVNPPRDTEQGVTVEDGQVRAEPRSAEDPKGRPTPSRPASHRRRDFGGFAEGTV